MYCVCNDEFAVKAAISRAISNPLINITISMYALFMFARCTLVNYHLSDDCDDGKAVGGKLKKE